MHGCVSDLSHVLQKGLTKASVLYRGDYVGFNAVFAGEAPQGFTYIYIRYLAPEITTYLINFFGLKYIINGYLDP